ncbi:MAG: dihydropyrimidinase [Anaerolineales bacterium]|nr:dihydropyrimidinase [Chloroflexota bacterium]MBL6980758.1 dihydropyrimidinase [Anaerolineales bacterium]
MPTSILIKSGNLVTATESYTADILIQDEKIIKIAPNLYAQDAEIIDATGKVVMPGGIDPHVHLALPMFDTISSDDHYTGHKAAAFGGTTTVMDFVVQEPQGFAHSVDLWRRKAEIAAVDYGFHMNLTHFDKQVAKELPALLEMGITTLKVFTAYNGRLRLADGDIYQAMRIAKKLGMLTMLHAENGDVIDVLVDEALAAGHTSPEWHARTRPAWGAVEAAMRGFSLAAETGAPLYLVHMNVAGEVDMLQYARQKGIPVMGEACPQYLFFTEDDLRRPDGAKWICSPPMRTQADNDRLWEGLADDIIQVMGTDHCPFFFDGTTAIRYEGEEIIIPGKELGTDDFTKIPNGLPGVQDRMPILWTEGVAKGRITPNQFVAMMSTNPAKIFGLYPKKGALLPGSDADIVIWNSDVKVNYGIKRSHQRTDYSLYEGWALTGYPEKVYLRGKLIVDGEEWYGAPGMGEYLHRTPNGEIL